jgi:hypothetical protein
VNFTGVTGQGILSYSVLSSPGGFVGSCSAPCSSVNIGGLTNGTPYTFTVRATNVNGTSVASAASNAVTPIAVSQTITFGTNPGPIVYSLTATFAVNATASSGLPVNFVSTTTAVCTIAGTLVTVVAAGTCVIAADQSGDATYAIAPQVTQSVSITAAVQSIVFGSPPALVVNGIGTVSATGGASGNAVVFSSTTPAVCTVSGTNGTTVTGVSVGSCVVAANQAGNVNYSAAPQVTSTLVIGQGSQTITFSPPSSVNVGAAPIGLTASGGASGNPVTFTSQTTTVCTTSGTNGATLTFLTTGTCTVRASQAGNATFLAAANVDRSIAVGNVAPPAPTAPTAPTTTGSAR